MSGEVEGKPMAEEHDTRVHKGMLPSASFEVFREKSRKE